MHYFRGRVFFFLYEFISNAGVFFTQQNNLSGQTVAGGGHFNGVFRYPCHFYRGLPATGAKAGTHRYRLQSPCRERRFGDTGRYGLLYQSELFYALKAVEEGGSFQPFRAAATHHAQDS